MRGYTVTAHHDPTRGRPSIRRNPGYGLRCTPDPDAGAGGALLGNQMVSQVKDEVFYTGLIEMQELPDLSE